ncbi:MULTISPECIES: hypothetical protein [unclassified Anabaena]|uniref:hypothetical protein n=1 Tax=unclassified Anabaena TaxID=2619674 RepID=UPI0039C68ECC
MAVFNKFLAIAISTGVTIATGIHSEIAKASSLIGDTIQYEYLVPDLSTVFESTTRVVQPGLADLITQTDGTFDIFTLNPESNGFNVNFSVVIGFSFTSFNGFRLSSLDFDDSSILTGYTLDTNMVGLEASHISFTSNTFSVNFQGLEADADTFIDVNFITSAVSTSVPEPSLMIGILSISGLGCASMLKRKSLL